MTERRSDKYQAAAITAVIAGALIAVLMLCYLTSPIDILAQSSNPQEEEEIFIEPMDLDMSANAGERHSQENDSPAPDDLGELQESDTPNPQKVEPGKNPEPTPARPPQVASQQTSEVKTPQPSAEELERQELAARTSGKFDRNGSPTGKESAIGSGGDGIGLSGTASGRNFLGCPKPDVTVRNRTIVRVTVTVTPEGNVENPRATGGNATLRKKCEEAARQAKWSPKKGVSTVGEITFIITPK